MSNQFETTLKRLLATWVGVLLPLALAHAQTAPGDSLSLQEAVQLVVGQNPQIKQAKASLNAVDARVTQSRSSFFPSVTATASYSRVDPVPEIGFGTTSFKTMPNNNYNFQVGAQMLLFDFGKRSDLIDLTLTQKGSQEKSLTMAERDLAYQTVQLFYGILFLQESIKVQDEQIEALWQNEDRIRKRVQTGTATEFNVLTAQVRIAAAQNRRTDLVNSLQNTEIALKRLLGIPEATPLKLKGSFAYEPATFTADVLVQKALSNRVELKMAQETETLARIQRSIASKGDLPTLSGRVAYGIKNGYPMDVEELRWNFLGAVELDVPIFTGFKVSGEKQEAEANIYAAEAKVLDTKQLITADVAQAISGIDASMAKLKTAETQVRQAKETAQQARVRYDNGVIATLDLLDAEVSLSEAELTQIQARYNYVMSAYLLKRATGEVIWQN
ncbi:MAG: TolC family protein [Chlorobiales bacterium]|jgi:outer membrane protein|nr:TolC family protein [Chlorobiales bacterium]